jgi:hypothetical protein
MGLLHTPLAQTPWPLSTAQNTPFPFGGYEQAPLAELQVPASWHESGAGQTTGLPPTHVPFWQVSVWVHASPSLQAVPLAASGFVQTPVVGLHVPARWHWSSAVQTTGFVPTQTPFWQVADCVQAFSSLQAVSFVALEKLVVLVFGLQTWQGLLGLAAQLW